MSQTIAGVALLIVVLAILLIIFLCLYYLWSKTKQLEALAKKGSIPKTQQSGEGNILGFTALSLYEVLKNQGDTSERLVEIKKSYAFYLSRHLEAAIEQGIIDQKKSHPVELESEMAVGGTRGEIISWLPLEVLRKFYQFGSYLRQENVEEEEKKELAKKLGVLVDEALTIVNMKDYGVRMSDLISGTYI
jgi:hypothetical protein